MWAAAQRAYARQCRALPAALSAQLAGCVSLLSAKAAFEDEDDNADVSELSLRVRMAAGGPGAELRFGYTHAVGWNKRAWRLRVGWRPLSTPPHAWRWLALAWLDEPPVTGLALVDEHLNRPAQLEMYDTEALTAAEVAALRAAIRGADEAPAELSDVALLTLALTACGALGLEDELDQCMVLGHTWEAEDAPTPQSTSWLEHALRAACGAPLPSDALYRGYDGADVKADWGEGVLVTWDRVGDGDPWAEDAVPAEGLWDHVEHHGCLPWDEGQYDTRPRSARSHQLSCAERVKARRREKRDARPAPRSTPQAR